jgi:hypothetical protein
MAAARIKYCLQACDAWSLVGSSTWISMFRQPDDDDELGDLAILSS